MRCPYCNKKVKDNAVRCEYCGAAIAGPPKLEDFLADDKLAEADEFLSEDFLTSEEQTTVKSKSKKTKIVVVVIILVTMSAGYIWVVEKVRDSRNAAQLQKTPLEKKLADKERGIQIANLLSRARTLRDSGRYDDALTCVSQALTIDVRNAEAEQLKLQLETLIEQERVKAEKEERFVAYCKAASAYEAKGEYDKAIEAYANALVVKGDAKEVQDKLADCQRKSEYGKLLNQTRDTEGENNLSESLLLKEKIESADDNASDINISRPDYFQASDHGNDNAAAVNNENHKTDESEPDKTDPEKIQKEIDALLQSRKFNEAIKKIRSELMPEYENQRELCQWKGVGEYILLCGRNYPDLITTNALQYEDLYKTIIRRIEEQTIWLKTQEEIQAIGENDSSKIVGKKLQMLDSYIANNYLSFFRPIAETQHAKLRDRLAVLRAKGR